jgi:hypothetical protein
MLVVFGFAGPPLFGVAFGALLRFFEAIRLALDSDDLGMVHESIDERDRAPFMRRSRLRRICSCSYHCKGLATTARRRFPSSARAIHAAATPARVCATDQKSLS